jgi:hypothetical protein
LNSRDIHTAVAPGCQKNRPAPGAQNSVFGTSGNDVFAVGCDSIVHYDGDAWTWSAIPVNYPACLHGVWADPVSKEAFAVGDAGLILHYTP